MGNVLNQTLIVPWQQPIVRPDGGLNSGVPRLGGGGITAGIVLPVWQALLQNMVNALLLMPFVVGSVALTAQAAAIAATDIPAPPFRDNLLTAGLYRVSYYAQIAQVATVSSSTTVTIRWTTNGVAQSRVGAVLNGNLTTTFDQAVFAIQCDADTAVTYEASYASAGATSMHFDLTLTLEQMPQVTT